MSNKETSLKEKLKQALSSTVKVISDDLAIEKKNQKKDDSKKFELFEINDLNNKNDFIKARAESDSSALKKKFSNENIYRNNLPKNSTCRSLYSIAEKIRYEQLGGKMLKGIEKNFKENYINTINLKRKDKLKTKDDVSVSEAFELYMIKNFHKVKLNDLTDKMLKFWEKEFDESIGTHIEFLNKNLENQNEYSQRFSQILEKMDIFDSDENEETKEENQNNDQNNSNNDEQDSQSPDDRDKNKDEENVENLDTSYDIDEYKLDEQLIDSESDKNDSEQIIQKKKIEDVNLEYKIFTNQFDEIIKAENLENADEAIKLRKTLDQQLIGFQDIITKLANKLQRQLLAKQNRAWEFDLEEGLLDSSRLPKIIINPDESLKFKNEKESIAKNTIVTLLIDNSGSMRGRPIIIAANAVEILTKTLERCGVKVEILGFTTREWKGGKSKIEWQENGKPSKPGRLNDLLHIIYKDSSKNWTNCSKNLGLFLKEGLLKENIDGEALEWANKRLSFKEQKRKILIVISDGAPVDDSTLSANNANILEKHLSDIVKDIENKKFINLIAIGIGHDVSKYYKKAFTIDDADKLAEIMLEKLTEILSNKKANS